LVRVDYSAAPFVCRKCRGFLLASCWLLGLVCGWLLFHYAGTICEALMRRIVISPVSISGLLSSFLIPFLITVYSVCFSMPWIIFPVCFLKGVSFSFVSSGIWKAFSSAGWLVQSVLLFRSSCFAVGAFLVWIRFFSGRSTSGAFFVWLLLAAAGCILDYSVISPFLASLIIH